MYVLVDIRYVIDNYEKTGCNRLQPVFYGFLKFFKLRQPATEPTAKRGNRNRWSGCFRLRSVRFWCFFRFRELDLQTLTEMEEWDAMGLLLKASCLNSVTSDVQIQASKIVKELFYFPLAIDQAGAYIASGATTIGDYLGKYSEHQKTLLSHSEFTGASKYNRTVYETWELSYREIQQRAKSDESHKANAANSAMLLLELFPFFHHEGITEEIFSHAALPEDDKTPMSNLPLASSLLDQRLLPLCQTGTWDNFIFREGI
jgi:hypothetical protein